ncbi:hypothetical protein L2D08_18035 [Domibacillus sp. PGB-M46]|uniref:hypothetical protein n=1 Tax=Domibacillus sp. PGB-M46 TaxID=2910255 RepID=UPI001F5904D3|nr:hypothetical protein [Domibacillus sp. PGB-M46]MCI2256247.1 hypothetical protein [Domibacillus sp. PGB-M46]
MSVEKIQEINKLKALMKNLLQYRECDITHNFSGLSLTYCNQFKTFIIKHISSGEIEKHHDIDTCSLAIYEKLNNEVKEAAE